ncbi:response regulator transcription factor [Azospirillum canadense]|uniref:response regulator transcription factor n=1 Tax=Azospirillum canadense TaxID=403962 RepID=UPI002226EE1B|nr:response regulator transcription factor [Azospirillum canadense]MCW2243596.1 DNA-binding NarL/FixJ family response regulator [Azospirillum canadense]
MNSEASDEREESTTGTAENGRPDLMNARDTQSVTVLLLDDVPLTRECLSLSINICDRGVRVLTATSVSDAAQLFQGDTKPDVVLCSFTALDSTEGLFASQVRDVVEAFGSTPLIVLSEREDGGVIHEAFQCGAHGYISTAVDLSVALEAIRLVAAGGTFVPADFPNRLMKDNDGTMDQRGADEDASSSVGHLSNGSPMSELTPRQRSVLKCMKEGKPYKIIAHELGMGTSTVKTHVRSILKKLGLTNRAEAVNLSLRDTD